MRPAPTKICIIRSHHVQGVLLRLLGNEAEPSEGGTIDVVLRILPDAAAVGKHACRERAEYYEELD